MDPYATQAADILDLAGMRTGLPRHDFALAPGLTSSDLLAKMAHLKPSAELRQVMQYNNMHYSVLAHVVSKITGTAFGEWVEKNIFEKLGMGATSYNHTQTMADGFALKGVNLTQCLCSLDVHHLDASCGDGLQPFPALAAHREVPYDPNAAILGHGGVITSPRDLVSPPLLPPPSCIVVADGRPNGYTSCSPPPSSTPQLSTP